MLAIILCFCQCLSDHWKQSSVLAARWHGWLKKTRLGFLKIKLILMFCQNKLYPCMLVWQWILSWNWVGLIFSFHLKLFWYSLRTGYVGLSTKHDKNWDLPVSSFSTGYYCSVFFILCQLVCTSMLAWGTQLFSPSGFSVVISQALPSTLLPIQSLLELRIKTALNFWRSQTLCK